MHVLRCVGKGAGGHTGTLNVLMVSLGVGVFLFVYFLLECVCLCGGGWVWVLCTFFGLVFFLVLVFFLGSGGFFFCRLVGGAIGLGFLVLGSFLFFGWFARFFLVRGILILVFLVFPLISLACLTFFNPNNKGRVVIFGEFNKDLVDRRKLHSIHFILLFDSFQALNPDNSSPCPLHHTLFQPPCSMATFSNKQSTA